MLEELFSGLLPPFPLLTQDPSTVAKPMLRPGGCGGGSWACVVSVFHLGLVSRVSDELHSVLGQDSSALLPLSKFCPQSLAGPLWCEGISSPPTLQVFLQNSKAALTAWPSLLGPPTQLNFTNHTSLHVPAIRIPDLNKAVRLL